MKLPAATGGDINSTDLPGRSFNEGRSLPAFPSSAVTPWRDGGRALFELPSKSKLQHDRSERFAPPSCRAEVLPCRTKADHPCGKTSTNSVESPQDILAMAKKNLSQNPFQPNIRSIRFHQHLENFPPCGVMKEKK
jgi:hypothetical protein